MESSQNNYSVSKFFPFRQEMISRSFFRLVRLVFIDVIKFGPQNTNWSSYLLFFQKNNSISLF